MNIGIDKLPPNTSRIYDRDQITEIVARMAGDIEADLAAENPIVIPILIGGAYTAVRLCEYFGFPYEVDSVRVARYGPTMASGELHWYARPCLELDGRHVLLVDDILDKGVTLHAVERELRRMNAAAVSSAVLIRKQLEPGIERPAVDYVGADAPNQYLFGCGMDLEGRWRGLPELYAVDPD